MKEHNQYKSFTFKNHSDNIQDILTTVLAHISEMEKEYYAEERLIPRAKWLIVELLTNTVKHSEADMFQLNIAFDGKQLLVQKEDYGKPLILRSCTTDEYAAWPLDKNAKKQKIHIYHDAINQLHAVIHEDGTASFHASETPCENRNNCIDSLSEHFGLLIITRSTDEFTYQYEETTGVNIFRCYINLDTTTANNS